MIATRTRPRCANGSLVGAWPTAFVRKQEPSRAVIAGSGEEDTRMSAHGRHSVLGLGGVFIRARDPAALSAWYREHLGFDVHDFGGAFGTIFKFAEAEPGYQIWTAFPADTPYFGDAGQSQMLNFRV